MGIFGCLASTRPPPHTWALWPQVGLAQVAGGCRWGYPAGKEADLQHLPLLVLLLVVLLLVVLLSVVLPPAPPMPLPLPLLSPPPLPLFQPLSLPLPLPLPLLPPPSGGKNGPSLALP